MQVDLGEPVEIALVVGTHDSYNNIGDGFGFPVRYKLEASNDAKFAGDTVLIADLTGVDQRNPGIAPQHFKSNGAKRRYVRLTATKLVERKDDFILAVAELQVRDASGNNLARGKTVTALDSIEAPPAAGSESTSSMDTTSAKPPTRTWPSAWPTQRRHTQI